MERAIERLLDGYRRFRAETWPEARERYQRLSESGQTPRTLVVACSDSRVDPATVFGAGPGEMFVIRNVAGLIPPYVPDGGNHGTSAALEYGVRVLKVEQIVVLGHARCGGVAAMAQGAPAEARDFVESWMQIAKDALAHSPALHGPHGQDHDALEEEVVRLSMTNLRSFPWIAAREQEGLLRLEGCRFDIHTGILSRLVGNRFEPVT
jgi:carbonic anhydrase